MPHDPRQGPQYQSTSKCRNSTTPIAVRPVAEAAQSDDREQPAQQRPRWWQPSLQHPADCRTHQPCAQPHPPERVPKDYLACSQTQTLCRIEHCTVRRFVVDVKILEVSPQRMGWDALAPMSEC